LSLDLHGRGAGKIFLPDQVATHSLEVGQCAVPGCYVFLQNIIESLILLEAQYQYQRFLTQLFLRPDIVRGENRLFLYWQTIEDGLDIFGIDVLSTLGNDHVLLAPKEL
jgi:hypothetical protein